MWGNDAAVGLLSGLESRLLSHKDFMFRLVRGIWSNPDAAAQVDEGKIGPDVFDPAMNRSEPEAAV